MFVRSSKMHRKWSRKPPTRTSFSCQSTSMILMDRSICRWRRPLVDVCSEFVLLVSFAVMLILWLKC
jgi:hypothetical protein